MVKPMAQVAGINQTELDQMLLQSPPDRAQYQATFMQGFNDVSVVAVSQGRLGSRIAHLIRVKYSVRSGSLRDYLSVRMAKSFAPGESWVLTCGGKGKTQAEAEDAFTYWQADINRVFSSFESK